MKAHVNYQPNTPASSSVEVFLDDGGPAVATIHPVVHNGRLVGGESTYRRACQFADGFNAILGDGIIASVAVGDYAVFGLVGCGVYIKVARTYPEALGMAGGICASQVWRRTNDGWKRVGPVGA